MWKSKAIRLVLVSLVIITMLAGGGCFNKAPVITSLTPSSTTVASGDSCTINCVATDADGDTIIYSWSASEGAISGAGSTITWLAPTTVGNYTVTVSVSDGKAAAVSQSCTIQVFNTAPVIASLTPSSTNLAPSASCTINCAASDADGDTLTYEWTPSGGTISGTGNNVSWTAPATEGIYTVTVTVSDGKGGTASESCNITVEMKYGSLDIQSSPVGAAVYLDGVDTGNITPYVITNLAPGSYTVTLELYHYKYRQQTVTVAANETTYLNWSLTYATEQTLTIQPAAAAGIDSGATTFAPGTNYGGSDEIVAGYGVWGIYRTYIEFNLTSFPLPENAVITSAKLGLFYQNSYGAAVTPIGAYLVLGSWDESTITWNNKPVSATTPVYTYNVPASETNAFVYWYITDLVLGWRDGSILNLGVVLMDTDESTAEAEKGFHSSDWGTATERPKLVITYYDPTP